MTVEERRKRFLRIFKRARKQFGPSAKRLAAEGWDRDWQTLIATIMSAQNRDEVTIPAAEKLFDRFSTLDALARAPTAQIERTIANINYYKTKAKHIKRSAKMLIEEFHKRVPDTIGELTRLPGVGRKTANLVLSEIHAKDAICVDTHVHRISNVLGFVDTNTRDQTEAELKKIVPKKYWSQINRIFVLWGKKVPGRDPERLLEALE